MISAGPPRLAGIDVAGLSKAYQARHGRSLALQDVTFTVRAGEFAALIGPSGCGKTTLLHILAGLIEPTAGSVSMPRRHPGRLGTALVFQGASTLPWMTALDNVAYGLRLMGVPARERRERARQHLGRVGLLAFSDAYPHQLSEGMRQRVNIARALATDPAILLMDEPFADLDEQNRLLLQDELLRIWQEDRKTVLFVTHSLVALTRTGELPYHVGVSVERIIAGFLLGSIPAVALGLAMGLSRSVRALLMPIVTAIYPIPKIAIYPLIIFYLGIGEASKVSIVALSIFFLVLLNTMAGVLGMDRTYFNIARAYGARSIDVFTTIAWPGALPSIFTGLKLGMGFAMIVIVGAELLGSDAGIGFLIWRSYQSLAIDVMFAGLLVTAVLGWLATITLDWLERRAMPWRTEQK